MFANYLFVTLQNLKRQPGFSAIKILSLSIGLVCSILVLMHVQYTSSYDKHIPNWQNTYRLVTSLTSEPVIHTDITADPYAAQLVLDYPQIREVARIRPAGGLFATEDDPTANSFHWADPEIIDIFSLNFVSGDAATALQEPNSLVINQTVARKYFPTGNPLGQTLTLDNLVDLNVTGVIEDLPDNTHVDLQMLIPVSTAEQMYGENFMGGSDWTQFTETRTYLSFADTAAAREVSADLDAFVTRNFPVGQREYAENRNLALYLEPLADIYLSPRRGFSAGNDTHALAIYFVSMIALLVLVTACINFANLSLSQLRQRSKELGVRKALGAKRRQIVAQFLLESVLQTLLAMLIALPIVFVLTPVYTAIIGSSIGVAFTPAILLEGSNLAGLLGFVLATGLLAGLVPAIVLSRHEPAKIIRDARTGSRRSRIVRQLVSVAQFTFSSTIVLVTIAALLQMDYMTNMDIGFERNGLIVLDTAYNPADPARFNYEAMKNEIGEHPAILAMASSETAPPSKGVQHPWRLPGSSEDNAVPVRHLIVGEDYLEAMGLELLAGRNFERDFATDFIPLASLTSAAAAGGQEARGIIITRNALVNFGFATPESALDQIFMLEDQAYRVLGVVDDFYFSGAISGSLPLTNILRATLDPQRYLLLRIEPGQSQSAMAHLDAVWEKHRADVPLNRTFYELRYNGMVNSWRAPIMNTTGFASVITVLISICGLYALAYYSTQRRTKEIGIRKVLGASSGAVVALLSWDFLKPVLLASVIATVFGYYTIGLLYSLFISSPAVPVWLYLLVPIGTLAIAGLTVATQCYRAATTNPVRSLRYE